ncbi:uncharacterized protein LOC126687743 [Mercurialis annua]|uniref:uncharacterized protein LOC126687743 n=1 Tax=Mercurialis annua TaxID=3986 RepID=UPI00215E461B|nr:uncharacterized protein LOC126687743 [Mercurialis annua]
MYKLYQKLKLLRDELRRINKTFYSDISLKIERIKEELDILQMSLTKDPFNLSLQDEKRTYSSHLCKLLKWDESIKSQKSRMLWINLGDQNSNFFHKSIKQRQARNRIIMISNSNGNVTNPDGIKEIFLNHYKQFIGSTCPDGYSSAFFKKNWSIVGREICNAVREFFQTGKLLKQVNSTSIALIPKVMNPKCVGDYRPTGCCNVTYKIISKILSSRLSKVLNLVVNESQSAFVKGRNITDNVLLAHEIIRNYHRGKGNSCSIKVDIQKAYDSILGISLKKCL